MDFNILVADDEAEIRDLLRLYLEKEHYNVVEASDGDQALELLSKGGISLCILDVMMPGTDGFRVLRPENCLSVTAGLVLGPIGALACSLGNLVSDCFHGMYRTAALGFVGNFILAFVPYKAWVMLARERPSAHTWRHLLRYAWVAA